MFKAVRLNAVTYPLDPAEREELARCGADLTAVEAQKPHEILEAATDCDALLVVSAYVPRAVIEGLTRCRVIVRLGPAPTALMSRRQRDGASWSAMCPTFASTNRLSTRWRCC